MKAAIDVTLNGNDSAGLVVLMTEFLYLDVEIVYGSLTKNGDNC